MPIVGHFYSQEDQQSFIFLSSIEKQPQLILDLIVLNVRDVIYPKEMSAPGNVIMWIIFDMIRCPNVIFKTILRNIENQSEKTENQR
jgi:hypothetical protein